MYLLLSDASTSLRLPPLVLLLLLLLCSVYGELTTTAAAAAAVLLLPLVAALACLQCAEALAGRLDTVEAVAVTDVTVSYRASRCCNSIMCGTSACSCVSNCSICRSDSSNHKVCLVCELQHTNMPDTERDSFGRAVHAPVQGSRRHASYHEHMLAMTATCRC
jgi:hypothetical protein